MTCLQIISNVLGFVGSILLLKTYWHKPINKAVEEKRSEDEDMDGGGVDNTKREAMQERKQKNEIYLNRIAFILLSLSFWINIFISIYA